MPYFIAMTIGAMKHTNSPTFHKPRDTWHDVLNASCENKLLCRKCIAGLSLYLKNVFCFDASRYKAIKKCYRIIFQYLLFSDAGHFSWRFPVIGEKVV